MNFSTLKKLAVTSAVALTLFAGAEANAQATTTTIGGTFSTAAALTSASVTGLDFGTWAINIAGGDTLTLPLLSTNTGAAPATPICGGVVDAATICTNTVAPAQTGEVTVTSPIAGNLQVQGNVTVDFTDASLSLGTLTFTDGTSTNTALPAAYDGATFVNVVTGAVAERVGIGGTLTISGATPAAASTFADATVEIGFTY